MLIQWKPNIVMFVEELVMVFMVVKNIIKKKIKNLVHILNSYDRYDKNIVDEVIKQIYEIRQLKYEKV